MADLSTASTNEEILTYALDRDPDFIGIDAPLIVENEQGEWPVETELKRLGISVHSSNRTRFEDQFGRIRGEILREAFEEAGYSFSTDTSVDDTIIEVYPYSTIRHVIGDTQKYKNVNKSAMHSALVETWCRTIDVIDYLKFGEYIDLVPESTDDAYISDLKAVGDKIDAFYSALVLKIDFENRGDTRTLGNLRDGSILTAI